MGLTAYEKTVESAVTRGVKVTRRKMSRRIPAIALSVGEKSGAFIDEAKFRTDADRRLSLEHEIKHCELGLFYNNKTPKAERERIESKVMTATLTELVSFNLYVKTISSGCFDEWEQAEKWCIPQKHLQAVHRLYESTHRDEVYALKLQMAEIYGFD